MIKLELLDVFRTRGKSYKVEPSLPLKSYDRTGVEYEVVDISPIRLEFTNIDIGKVSVKGSFEIELLIPCDRCLKNVSNKISCEVENELLSDEVRVDDDDAEELSYLHGYEFDVLEFVSLSVLMNMPSKVLCREDCKGLCPVCGSDLNEHDCGCDSFVPDPRMARIADIFNASKEV